MFHAEERLSPEADIAPLHAECLPVIAQLACRRQGYTRAVGQVNLLRAPRVGSHYNPFRLPLPIHYIIYRADKQQRYSRSRRPSPYEPIGPPDTMRRGKTPPCRLLVEAALAVMTGDETDAVVQRGLLLVSLHLSSYLPKLNL